MVASDGTGDEQLLARAGAVEAGSKHPIGQAITAGARETGVVLPPVSGFHAATGHGVRADVGGSGEPPATVWVGRRKLMAEAGLLLPERLDDAAARLEADGKSAVLAGWDGEVRGVLGVADTLKDGAEAVGGRLHRMGLGVAMITGDNARTAETIARRVDIDRVLAEVLPRDKVGEVERLQAQGEVVAMVGDGVNDAPALVQADLGIALGTGTDVAIESGDLTLLRGDLEGVPTAIDLSRRTYRTIVQNLAWAFGYNVAAIPPPPSACSTRSSPGPRWRSPASASSRTPCGCVASAADRSPQRSLGHIAAGVVDVALTLVWKRAASLARRASVKVPDGCSSRRAAAARSSKNRSGTVAWLRGQKGLRGSA